jgi:hypothetical protein
LRRHEWRVSELQPKRRDDGREGQRVAAVAIANPANHGLRASMAICSFLERRRFGDRGLSSSQICR